MIKKIYSISVYDYVDMLNEEIGFKWNDDNIWFPSQHLYKGQSNSIDIDKNKRKKQKF